MTLYFEQSKEDDNLYRLRKWKGLSKSTRDLIRLITLRHTTRPVGSYKYTAHRYPSDIDIFETFNVCCDRDTATREIAKKIQQMAKNINKHPTIYWGDFKAGIDMSVYASDLKSSQDCKNHLKNIRPLLSKTETDMLLSEIDKPEIFSELIRKMYTVRWSAADILSGKKTLKSGQTLRLEDAISQNTLVKIDLWAPIDGRYNEITNFFIFGVEREDGTVETLNIELGNRIQALVNDLIKYSSPDHYNPLKLAKRLWNYALVIKDHQLAKNLVILFSSEVAHLNQMISEMEVVVNLIKKYESKNIPVDILIQQFETYKKEINDMHDIDLDFDQIFQLIYDIIDSLNKCSDNDTIVNIVQLSNLISERVKYYSDFYLRSNRLDKMIIDIIGGVYHPDKD